MSAVRSHAHQMYLIAGKHVRASRRHHPKAAHPVGPRPPTIRPSVTHVTQLSHSASLGSTRACARAISCAALTNTGANIVCTLHSSGGSSSSSSQQSEAAAARNIVRRWQSVRELHAYRAGITSKPRHRRVMSQRNGYSVFRVL